MIHVRVKMGWGIEIRPIEFCRAKTIAMSNP